MFNHVYTCLYMVTYHNKTKLLKLEKWKKYIAKHIALLTFSALPGAFTHPGFPSSHLLFWGLIILNHFQSIPEIDPKDILPKKITERNHKKRDFHMVDILYKFTIKKTRSLVNHRKRKHPVFLVEKRRQRGRRFAEVHDILQRHVSCLGMATIGTRLCT